jgi:hypothetical protein
MLSLALHHPEYGDAGEHHDTSSRVVVSSTMRRWLIVCWRMNSLGA